MGKDVQHFYVVVSKLSSAPFVFSVVYTAIGSGSCATSDRLE